MHKEYAFVNHMCACLHVFVYVSMCVCIYVWVCGCVYLCEGQCVVQTVTGSLKKIFCCSFADSFTCNTLAIHYTSTRVQGLQKYFTGSWTQIDSLAKLEALMDHQNPRVRRWDILGELKMENNMTKICFFNLKTF